MTEKAAKRNVAAKDFTDPSTEMNVSDEAKVESEIVLGYRRVEVSEFAKFGGKKASEDKDKKYVRIHKTTIGQESTLDAFYSEQYSEMLKNSSILTEEETECILLKRGMNLAELREQLDDLDEEQKNVIKSLQALNAEKASESLIAKAKNQRDDLKKQRIELWEKIRNCYKNTIERRCEEYRTLCKLQLCVKDDNDKLLWNSVEELKNEPDDEFVGSILSKALYFWVGIDETFFDKSLDDLAGLTG